jgi:hypothetical protein
MAEDHRRACLNRQMIQRFHLLPMAIELAFFPSVA